MSSVLTWTGAALMLCGLVIVGVSWVRGGSPVRLHGEDPQTRRAVQQAIRDGGTDDPRIDRLARRSLRSPAGTRWVLYLLGAMMLLSVVLTAVGPYTAEKIVLHLSQIALWATFIAMNLLIRRRRNEYRGLSDELPQRQ
ncbi:hypothetical protein [Mangrovihabitans endophyticus]|uniref:hypothetical protein n=1 Tax=Mangrovihabitans endophyticus TaxID=1751298 RepID=UPI001665B109|nr:hypothetical protein [Mangrovihabitans endophyticus]